MKTLALCLLLSACTYTAPCEDDEMDCRIPQERFTQVVDETIAITVPIVTIPNRNGCAMVALGSADTMGIVRLQPRTQQFTANVPIFVSARAPFIGNIDGPIDVFPVNGVPSGSVSNPTDLPILDIISFEREPNSKPDRAVFNYNDVLTLNGSGAGSSHNYRVTGRQRVRVQVISLAGHAYTPVISASGIGGVSPFAFFPLDAYTGTSTTSHAVEFSLPGLHTGAPHTVPGVSVIDYVSVAIVSGTAADPVTINVQAWD